MYYSAQIYGTILYVHMIVCEYALACIYIYLCVYVCMYQSDPEPRCIQRYENISFKIISTNQNVAARGYKNTLKHSEVYIKNIS